jgi:bifunctional non-homologous end joining protein LigD
VKPKLVAEIEFAGWTGDGNVRQAAFKGLREDKAPGEITTEIAEPAAEAEKRVASRKPERGAKKSGDRGATSTSGPAVVMGVTISNSDKPLWPDAGDAGAGDEAGPRALLRGSG